ncbi:MAG: hypothetical protein Q9184_005894 [Pyrenodesmia sp. 2 TL-2023]
MAVFASLRAIAFPPPPHPPPPGPLPELPPGATAGTPPSTPLPELPFGATPPFTPRNASHLFGEYSWPSLDTVELQSRLEDVVAEAEDNSPKEVDNPHDVLFSINQLVTAMHTIVSESPLTSDLYSPPAPKMISLAKKLRKDFERIRPEYLPANEEELKDHLEAKADYHHQVTMLHIDSGFCFEGCPLDEDCAFFEEGCPYRLGHECWGSLSCEHTLLEEEEDAGYYYCDQDDEEAPRFAPEWEESDEDAGAAGSSDYYQEWYHNICHEWAQEFMTKADPVKRGWRSCRLLRPLVLLVRRGAKCRRQRRYGR